MSTRIPCDYCNRSYNSIQAKQQHILASHGMMTVSNNTVSPKKSPTGSGGYGCSACGKFYDSEAILRQHMKDKHKQDSPSVKAGQLPCHLCSKSYAAPDQLFQHMRDKHPTETNGSNSNSQFSPGKFLCLYCKRSFPTEGGLFDHCNKSHPETLSPQEKAELSKKKPHPCNECNDSFDSEHALLQHKQKKHIQLVANFEDMSIGSNSTDNSRGSSDEHVCTTCYKTFETHVSAAQHKAEKKDHIIKKSSRKLAVDCFLKAAQVENPDRKESEKVFNDIMKRIMDHVRLTKEGKIYSPSVRRAGSTAVNVKIGKADEFDTNIPLNITARQIITDGYIDYLYEDKEYLQPGDKVKVNLNVDRNLKTGIRTRIPDGQAVVKVDTRGIPPHLLHEDDLIPHKCQKDLYDRVKAAITELKLKGVNLSREAHGPAITLTIVPDDGHYISVDLTLSLDCKLTLSQYGWPRETTRRAFNSEKITECLKTPLHLVPKGGETWSISFSLVEKTFLTGIDTDNGCRRHVMQIMKRHLQICSSQKSLEGISSYIVKQQIMWSAEKFADAKYWHQKNMDTCVIDVMRDFITTLRQRRLSSFFINNRSTNILEHKKRNVIMALLKYFEEEKSKLERME